MGAQLPLIYYDCRQSQNIMLKMFFKSVFKKIYILHYDLFDVGYQVTMPCLAIRKRTLMPFDYFTTRERCQRGEADMDHIGLERGKPA